jgi:hypothetical protein
MSSVPGAPLANGTIQRVLGCHPSTAATLGQAPVTESLLVLPPVTREHNMDHSTPSDYAAITAECARKSRAMDDRLAEWGPKLMDKLGRRQDTLARSRHLLGALNNRDAKLPF